MMMIVLMRRLHTTVSESIIRFMLFSGVRESLCFWYNIIVAVMMRCGFGLEMELRCVFGRVFFSVSILRYYGIY